MEPVWDLRAVSVDNMLLDSILFLLLVSDTDFGCQEKAEEERVRKSRQFWSTRPHHLQQEEVSGRRVRDEAHFGIRSLVTFSLPFSTSPSPDPISDPLARHTFSFHYLSTRVKENNRKPVTQSQVQGRTVRWRSITHSEGDREGERRGNREGDAVNCVFPVMHGTGWRKNSTQNIVQSDWLCVYLSVCDMTASSCFDWFCFILM